MVSTAFLSSLVPLSFHYAFSAFFFFVDPYEVEAVVQNEGYMVFFLGILLQTTFPSSFFKIDFIG